MAKKDNINGAAGITNEASNQEESIKATEDTATTEQEAESKGEKEAEGEGEQDTEDETGKDVPKILTAVYPILYLSHQYRVGDELPTNTPDMVQAWLDAGTAVWKTAVKENPKAKPRTAEPGLPGQASPSESADGDNLVGKVPKTNARKR